MTETQHAPDCLAEVQDIADQARAEVSDDIVAAWETDLATASSFTIRRDVTTGNYGPNAMYAYEGVMDHHTAGSRSSDLSILTRSGSGVSANYYVTKTGEIFELVKPPRRAWAAGNEQRGRSDYTSDGRSPASAKGTCTVGCGDIDGNLSSFSSWGKCVDIRAVGEAQESWGITGRKVLSGTSMASPVVAAAGAVCGSKGASVGEIDRALYAMTGDTGYSWVQEGRGILDVEFAVKKIERKARRK